VNPIYFPILNLHYSPLSSCLTFSTILFLLKPVLYSCKPSHIVLSLSLYIVNHPHILSGNILCCFLAFLFTSPSTAAYQEHVLFYAPDSLPLSSPPQQSIIHLPLNINKKRKEKKRRGASIVVHDDDDDDDTSATLRVVHGSTFHTQLYYCVMLLLSL
jgi:hypothetical protein